MTKFEDEVATRRLASVYCSACDDGDGAKMASLFVPGGALSVFSASARAEDAQPLRRWVGAEGFGKLTQVLKASYVQWTHFLGNHWVEIDGDQALGEAYVFACHLRDGDQGQEEEVAIIRYRDSYLRTADGWRFVERKAYRQWTTVRPIDARRHGIDEALRGA